MKCPMQYGSRLAVMPLAIALTLAARPPASLADEPANMEAARCPGRPEEPKERWQVEGRRRWTRRSTLSRREHLVRPAGRWVNAKEYRAYDEALEDSNEAIRLDLKKAEAYYFRAVIWQAKGASAQPMADFRHCVDLDPSFGSRQRATP